MAGAGVGVPVGGAVVGEGAVVGDGVTVGVGVADGDGVGLGVGVGEGVGVALRARLSWFGAGLRDGVPRLAGVDGQRDQ